MLRPALLLLVGLAAAALPPAAAATGRDTSRVDVAWTATASGRQAFTWTASATSPPLVCGTDDPSGPTRDVHGGGTFALTFATPRPYRVETVQILRRAGRSRGQRTLSYRPRGAPRLEDDVRFPVDVSIAGAFTDEVRACDAFDASRTDAPGSGCGHRRATLDLRLGFGVFSATTRNDAGLTGTLVRPWFLDANGNSTCPTYRSAAQEYFDAGRGTPACPSTTALDPYDGPPESGLASYFTKGRFAPRLLRARPKAFTLTADRRMDCTLGPAEGHFPPVAAGGALHVTGALRYTWRFTPHRVTGRAARPRPL